MPSYGEPPAPPPPEVFPSGLCQLMRAMSWFESVEIAKGERTAAGLRGTAGGGGRYTGTVRVLGGPADFGRLRGGEVVVCRASTASWTIVFPIAGAIVTDVGGALSHAAIVARELALPAVLGTREATRTLRDGQRVTVDGDRGVVEIGPE